MSKRLSLTLLGLLGGLSAALAQSPPFPASLPPHTLVGNLGPVAGPARAVPVTSVFTSLALSGPLTISGNTVGLPVAAPATTYLEIIGANGVIPRITMDSFGSTTGPVIGPRQARGTAASPTATQTNDFLFVLGGSGYQGGGAYSTASPQISFQATENYSSGHNGANIQFTIVPTGTASVAIAMTLQASGNLSLNPVSADGLTITGVATSTNKGFNITQSGPTSGTTAGPVNLNLITVSGYNATTTGTKFADFGAWSSSIVASRVNFTVGGSNITSTAEPFMAFLGHTRITTAVNAGQIDFEGVTGITYTNVNINSGTMEGTVGAVVIDNGGTANIVAGVWAEADVRTGGAVTDRFGINIDSEGDLSGSGNDAAIGMGVGSAGAAFKTGMLLNVISSISPIKTTGDLVASNGALTIANVFKASNWTVTGNIMNFPNFLLTGAGVGTFGPNNAAASGVQLVVNKNTVAVPLDGLTGVTTQIASADSAATNRVVIRAPNGIPVINFIHSRGTLASPTATQLNDFIGAFGAFGRGATVFGTGAGAAILFQATQNWTDAAMGTNIAFQSTPNGTTASATALTIQQSGGVTIGAATTDGGIGSLQTSTAIKSQGAAGGIGYATGAGLTVTQLTNKATAVTINSVTGTITMNNAALAAATIVTFVVNDSSIAATDAIFTAHESGGTTGAYTINCRATGAGTAACDVRNNTAGSLSEAIVIRFWVAKSVNSFLLERDLDPAANDNRPAFQGSIAA